MRRQCDSQNISCSSTQTSIITYTYEKEWIGELIESQIWEYVANELTTLSKLPAVYITYTIHTFHVK